ncbi:hypothetical protein FRB96_002643 [Tulasnella sp. 330]|nr:hypothetical protein FRB96_002643 [Tulasnella sp. 330]
MFATCAIFMVSCRPIPIWNPHLNRRGKDIVLDAHSDAIHSDAKPVHERHAWELESISEEEVQLLTEMSKFEAISREEDYRDWEIIDNSPDTPENRSSELPVSRNSNPKVVFDDSTKSRHLSTFIQDDYEPTPVHASTLKALQYELQREANFSART